MSRIRTAIVCLLFLGMGLGVTAMGVATGFQTDAQVQQLLSAQGPVEVWQASIGHVTKKMNITKESPLVRQAKIYANLLNPPEPPKPKTPVLVENEPETHPEPQIRPERSSPKFEVYVTSVYRSNPAKSMALISEPGSGFRWVRPGDQIGYLTVNEIKPQAVVCLDGDRIDTVVWECRTMDPDLPGLGRPDKSTAYARNVNKSETSTKVSRENLPSASRERSKPPPHPIERPMQPMSPRSRGGR